MSVIFVMEPMKTYFLFVLLICGRALAQISPDDFIADFESGNIANVQQVGLDSFTIEIRMDDSHGDTYGWYYFAIVNNPGPTVTLFLTNPDGWQNATCNPLTSTDNVDWVRVENVWSQSGMLCWRQFLSADTVWFAQDFPFTVSRVYSYLDSMQSSSYVERVTLGYSVHDRPIDMITITDPAVPLSHKKTVWLISRQHPMESPATFLLTGLIDRVLDSDDFSSYFRRDINLKIVPIVNVDGVAEGYSRHNVNGINLNRDWSPDMEAEEPEVRSVHSAIDGYISWGNNIDLFMDLHAAPDHYDFGYRMSEIYTDPYYRANQGTFLHLLDGFDQWQDDSRWRDLDTSYALGVSCVTLYDMYRLDVFSSENPWTRREDESFITEQSLYNQGPGWAETIYDYVYPLNIFGSDENRIDSISPGDFFVPQVIDFDQRNSGYVPISAVCPESGDSETVTLYRQTFEGEFEPFDPVMTDDLPPEIGDGIVSLVLGGEMVVSYSEPGIPDRVTRRFISIEGTTPVAEGEISKSPYRLRTYPNPFNSSVTIAYSGPEIRGIGIFDILGRRIREIRVDDQAPGRVIWDATDCEGRPVSAGVYFVISKSQQGILTNRITYLK